MEMPNDKFSGINIVGTFIPPFPALNQAEEEKLVAQVAQGKPDILGWALVSQTRTIYGGIFPQAGHHGYAGAGRRF
jgi:hypothetical protein